MLHPSLSPITHIPLILPSEREGKINTEGSKHIVNKETALFGQRLAFIVTVAGMAIVFAY